MSVVTYDRQGHIAVITMNRPEQLNTLSQALVQGLAEAWTEYQTDDQAWIAIITGTGRAFSAGLDIKERQAIGDGRMVLPESTIRDPYWHQEMDKPTIAAVNGYAYGGGFFLAAYADLRVAADNATFQITEIQRGLIAGYQLELTQNLPSGIVAELAVGETLNARRAFEVGFVNRLADTGGALNEALRLAEGILERPPLAIDYNLRLVRRLRTRRVPDEVHQQARAWQRELLQTEDQQESVRAFLERRQPVYRRR